MVVLKAIVCDDVKYSLLAIVLILEIIAMFIFIYYTALLDAVERSIHLNGSSQCMVVNYLHIIDCF